MSDAKSWRAGASVGAVRRTGVWGAALVAMALCGASAHAGAIESLQRFVQGTASGESDFTQTVTPPDGAPPKQSAGHFAFERPNHFRFEYRTPYEQLIVGDGTDIWVYDPDLAQATVRKIGDTLDATPAALLAGQSLDKNFDLKDDGSADGLAWVRATPKAKEGTIRWMRAGFEGDTLKAIEIGDSFGQRSMMRLEALKTGSPLPASTFEFKAPQGVDVVRQ